jgi:catechol 2,3-dioxygenase-like lactoylglutathione lyase family enzyme
VPSPTGSDSSKAAPLVVGEDEVMTTRTSASVRPQPMIAVTDVEGSSAWYQLVLGATSEHGGKEYEQLHVDGVLILQLHLLEEAHHHGTIGTPSTMLGNGVALWFESDAFDEAVERCHGAGDGVHIETDVHTNPNAGHREIWLRDPDGYLVVLAEPYA